MRLYIAAAFTFLTLSIPGAALDCDYTEASYDDDQYDAYEEEDQYERGYILQNHRRAIDTRPHDKVPSNRQKAPQQ